MSRNLHKVNISKEQGKIEEDKEKHSPGDQRTGEKIGSENSVTSKKCWQILKCLLISKIF